MLCLSFQRLEWLKFMPTTYTKVKEISIMIIIKTFTQVEYEQHITPITDVYQK